MPSGNFRQICRRLQIGALALPHICEPRGDECALALVEMPPLEILADHIVERVAVEFGAEMPDMLRTDLDARRHGSAVAVAPVEHLALIDIDRQMNVMEGYISDQIVELIAFHQRE